EADLDQIAEGRMQRAAWLRSFYFGDGDSLQGLKHIVENLGDIDARAVNSIPVGEGITLRVGRYGAYVERQVEGSADPVRASVPDDIAPDELTVEKAQELLERQKDDGRVLGTDPVSGHDIVAKDGRYGPYVTEVLPEPDEATPKSKRPKPRTASLFKSMDLATVNLEQALQLLSLPRVVGTAADGTEITAQNGRFGPYLKKGTDSRTLDAEEKLLTITLEEAEAIYAQPKQRGRAAAKPPLKELGVDPTSEKPIVVKDGRFGPYITDGTTNVTLRKDDVLEELTHEVAVERLAEKRAKGPAKKRTTTRKKATTTKKTTTAKKTTAKKSTDSK
ncbi:topoisomerase C-terminal repeat-containing protein, partial [Dermabacteraceae bacterium P13101]